MGFTAMVVGLGTFREGLVPHLEHDEDHYAHLSSGAPLVEVVFFAESGTQQSHRLAAGFGVGLWDLGSHHLSGEDADLVSLSEDYGNEEVERFLKLREAGFSFYLAVF